MPRLSVIVPGYNTRPEWWLRCVRSIAAALGPNDQIICVDDGSSTPISSFLTPFSLAVHGANSDTKASDQRDAEGSIGVNTPLSGVMDESAQSHGDFCDGPECASPEWARSAGKRRISGGPSQNVEGSCCARSSMEPTSVHLHLHPSPKIKLIRLEKNSGLPTARNAGLEAASDSQYVTFVDSDDEVRPETYSRSIEALEKHCADVAVFGVNGLYVDEKFQVHDLPDDKYFGPLSPDDVAQLVKRRLFYYSWNKVFRKSFLDEHGFKFYPEGVPCEDAIFNVRLVTEKAKWVTVAYEGYKYYRYDGSLLSSYKPTYMAGTRACTKAWHDYKASTPGAYEAMEKYGLGWYDETSEDDIIRGEWTNIWRRNSPYSLSQRWTFAADHKSQLGHFTLLVFLSTALKMFLRRHFYLKPIRRWHQQRVMIRRGAKVEPLRGEG